MHISVTRMISGIIEGTSGTQEHQTLSARRTACHCGLIILVLLVGYMPSLFQRTKKVMGAIAGRYTSPMPVRFQLGPPVAAAMQVKSIALQGSQPLMDLHKKTHKVLSFGSDAKFILFQA